MERRSVKPCGLYRVILVMFLSAVAAASDRPGKCPGWLPAGEVSPFYPDDAFTVHVPGQRQVYLRKLFDLGAGVRRAVLAVTGWHTVSVWLSGKLVAEYYGPGPDRVPRFTDVTDQVQSGTNELDVRVWSQWAPTVYAQLRIELADGSFRDVVTDDSWEWHAGPAESWPRGPTPAGGWRRVEVLDDYYGTMGKARNWSKEYALMPRAMLRQRLSAFRQRLRATWTENRSARKSRFDGKYVKPEYAAQYGSPPRIDPDCGQVVDATGKIRHLFFTIYGQKLGKRATLAWVDFDFDRLAHDLALMEASCVHPYVRFLGWSRLLDAGGNWQRCEAQPRGTGLPQFGYNYEVFDYFLNRCEAHGRFVAVECDFFWSAHWDTLPTPYHTRYYLYPEATEANALAHRKILSRYSERACIAGFLIGEEEIQMAHDLDNNHLRDELTEYLRERYGSIDKLSSTWRSGYDFRDRSLWKPVKRRPSNWGASIDGKLAEQILPPRYPLSDGFWERVTDWPQIELPVWPRFRWPQEPHAELMSHRAYMEHTDDDPTWIDYNTFREDVLYLRMVSRWAEIVREAIPKHWLFHSNAQDYTSQWHFIHFHRRAELPFDVIGVGSHDHRKNLSDIQPWHRVRKYLRVVASYRPYVLAPGSPAVAVSSGEGEGGKAGDEDAILNYYRGQSMEMVGHGAAFELSYTWTHMSGANVDPEGRARMTKALKWMGRFYRDVDGVRFSLKRDVPILIVRNSNLQRSNRSGRDFGNALGLIAALSQLNVELDVAMDQDLVYGKQHRKIDLAQYRMIFLPCIECDDPDPFWQELDAWLCDPAHRGERALVLGYVGKRTPYLTPQDAFHPTLAKWLGADDYSGTLMLRGSNEYAWRPVSEGSDAAQIRLHFGGRGDISPVGLFGTGTPILLTANGQPVGVATTHRGNAVYAFGFPLGLAFDNLWGLPAGLPNGKPAPQDPYDILASLYEDLVEATHILRPIRAPHNVRVAVSDDQSIIMVQELYGMKTTDLCTLRLPAGAHYEGCELMRQEDGRTLIRATLAPYGGLHFSRR